MSKTLSANYYQDKKERQQKERIIRKAYLNLSKEEKVKNWQYGWKRYKNVSEDEKQMLVSLEKKIVNKEKKALL